MQTLFTFHLRVFEKAFQYRIIQLLVKIFPHLLSHKWCLESEGRRGNSPLPVSLQVQSYTTGEVSSLQKVKYHVQQQQWYLIKILIRPIRSWTNVIRQSIYLFNGNKKNNSVEKDDNCFAMLPHQVIISIINEVFL